MKSKNKTILGASIIMVGGILGVIGNFYSDTLIIIGLFVGLAGLVVLITNQDKKK